MSDKSLLGVIESLLEADMTKKDTIKNPQESTENSVNAKNRTADGKSKDAKTEKPTAGGSSDVQGVLGTDGTAQDAGGDKDVGGSKGDNASAASPDTQGVLGKDGTAVDAGGDKDVGGSKGDNASDASADTQGTEGKASGSAQDAGGDKDVGKLKESDDADEDDVEVEEDHVPGANDNSEYGGKGEKTSPDTQGVLGKDGQAIDAGGDKDVGKLKESDDMDADDIEEESDEEIAGNGADKGVQTGGDEEASKLKESDDADEDDIGGDSDPEEVEEELTDKQKKLDKDGDGEIDGSDLAKVRQEECSDVEESDDMDADDEEGLEESFKERAQIIFETAVSEKASMIREELDAEYAAKFEEEKAKLDEKVSEYLDYAVTEWVQENALEIKYSLRTEIAENFIRGLKGLFEENYIEIPDEEVSVVDELTEAVESYKEQLEEQRIALAEANAEILEINKKAIVEDICDGLTMTQASRLEKLAEAVEAGDIDEFRYKVEALREGYFDESANTPFLGEEYFAGAQEEIVEDSSIAQYANFLGRTILK